MQGLAASSTRRLLALRSNAALTNGRVFASCRHSRFAPTRFSRSFGRVSPPIEEKEDFAGKPYYITTPIFYVNASPHVGHLFTMVLADVLKRWQVLKGERPAYLCTGTDEHGMKVQQAAELQDIPPKMLCDSNAEIFKDLANKANISNDYFIRTTDPEHKEAVEFFWRRLRDTGYIYETKHEGWYCVSDETFYPDNLVRKEVSPQTGKPFMASIETGNAVEWSEEKNYHFRMTTLKYKLLDFYEENPHWVHPATRMAEVVDWVKNNLEDLSISRPVNRMDWGIRVPDDPSQTIYVWVDALINYITVAGYPNWTPGSEYRGGWPADVHVIGKDIVRFHCIYWPALLMALDLPLPKRVISHAHWLMDSRKMSKSVGNVVNPFFALTRWGVDTIRYFLIQKGAIENDVNYSNVAIVESYKKGLQSGLGNLLNRVTRAKRWSVREAIEQMHEEGLESLGKHTQRQEISYSISKQRGYLETVTEGVTQLLDRGHAGRALNAIMHFIFETNRYIAATEPWVMAEEGGPASQELNQVVYLGAESLRLAAILLQPFIPEKSAELLDRLGVDPDRRKLKDAQFHGDTMYGTSLMTLGEGAQSSLFPPLPVET
ncbi:methionyl-tRNA synthetase [Xylariales sp. AK1849]|nr:methionyl-tRNA synthetase [Xylariales sp. AK1849]